MPKKCSRGKKMRTFPLQECVNASSTGWNRNYKIPLPRDLQKSPLKHKEAVALVFFRYFCSQRGTGKAEKEYILKRGKKILTMYQKNSSFELMIHSCVSEYSATRKTT